MRRRPPRITGRGTRAVRATETARREAAHRARLHRSRTGRSGAVAVAERTRARWGSGCGGRGRSPAGCRCGQRWAWHGGPRCEAGGAAGAGAGAAVRAGRSGSPERSPEARRDAAALSCCRSALCVSCRVIPLRRRGPLAGGAGRAPTFHSLTHTHPFLTHTTQSRDLRYSRGAPSSAHVCREMRSRTGKGGRDGHGLGRRTCPGHDRRECSGQRR